MPKKSIVGKIGKYNVVKTDYSDLTRSVDIYYKTQYIDSLTRTELVSINALLLSVLSLLNKKFEQLEVVPGSCTAQYPFEINICLYTIQKLKNLRLLLEAEAVSTNELLKSIADEEKSAFDVLKQFNEFKTFTDSLTENNVLKFILKDLKIEKFIEPSIIRNISLVYEDRLKQLQEKAQHFFERSGKKNNTYTREFESLKAFQPKYEKILEALEIL